MPQVDAVGACEREFARADRCKRGCARPLFSVQFTLSVPASEGNGCTSHAPGSDLRRCVLAGRSVGDAGLYSPSSGFEHDFPAAMRVAGEHLVGKRSLGKRQDFTNVRLERAIREQRA